MGKVFFILLFIITISGFVVAQISVGNEEDSGPRVIIDVPKITIETNFSVIGSNSSDFWDNLDTPGDIIGIIFLYNHSVNGIYPGDIFVNVGGDIMIGNLNISGQANLSVEGMLEVYGNLSVTNGTFRVAVDQVQNVFTMRAANDLLTPVFEFKQSRGTLANPNFTAGDSVMGSFLFDGFSPDGFFGDHSAGVRALASGDFTNSSKPSTLVFETTPSGSIIRSNQIFMDRFGYFGINIMPSVILDINETRSIATTFANIHNPDGAGSQSWRSTNDIDAFGEIGKGGSGRSDLLDNRAYLLSEQDGIVIVSLVANDPIIFAQGGIASGNEIARFTTGGDLTLLEDLRVGASTGETITLDGDDLFVLDNAEIGNDLDVGRNINFSGTLFPPNANLVQQNITINNTIHDGASDSGMTFRDGNLILG